LVAWRCHPLLSFSHLVIRHFNPAYPAPPAPYPAYRYPAVDVEITTGETSEGSQLPEQIDRIETNTGSKVKTVTSDVGYGHGSNAYEYCERNNIDAIIPPQNENTNLKKIPVR